MTKPFICVTLYFSMFQDESDQLLIFSAKMISDYQDDNVRQFAVRYYLADKTIAVFELKNNKLGIQGGRFLQRMKVKDPRTQQDYEDAAFAVGSKLQIAGRVFELIDAPEYTLCEMEAHPDRFPDADLQVAVQKLGDYSKEKGLDLHALFEEKDVTKSGFISADEAKSLLFSFAPGFSKQCSLTILRRFAKDDKFEYEDLIRYTE